MKGIYITSPYEPLPPLSWTAQTQYTFCGQHTLVVSNDNSYTPGGEVDLYFNQLSAAISGPDDIDAAGTYTWTAFVSGGNGSYTYQWEYQNAGSSNWISLGTGQSQSQYVDGSAPHFTLRVTVTSRWQTYAATLEVYWNVLRGVRISGPTLVWIGSPCTWTGSVDFGTPYTFEWDVYGDGATNPVRVDTTTNKSDNFVYQARTVGDTITISLTVTDAGGSSLSNSLAVWSAGYGCGY